MPKNAFRNLFKQPAQNHFGGQMGILDLFGNGKKKDYERLHERLDDMEEILRDISFKADDKFESVLFGIDAVMPEEKGRFLNRLEERVIEIKKGMVDGVIISTCSGEPKTYQEVRKEVRDRTALNITAAFLDDRIRNLSYARKLERLGNRYIASNGSSGKLVPLPTLVEKTEESAIAKEISPPVIPIPAPPLPPSGAVKLERLDMILKAAARLEKEIGSVPVPILLKEAGHAGIDEQTANQLIDEHLMLTGRLYEPKQGHVKLVRPLSV